MARIGIYPDAPKPPCVVGYEVAGTIARWGRASRTSASGQRVLAGTKFGGYASQVVVPASDVVALPDELTFEQGAALPVNYATAWAGLDRLWQPAAGRARADPLGRRRRGDRGDADRQASRRGGVRHGLARQARADLRARCRPSARLHQSRLGAGAAEVRPDHGRGRRQELSPRLRPAARGRAAWWRSAPRRLSAGEKRNLVSGLGTLLRMPRFNMVKQISESKAVIGLNMLSLWKDREHARRRGSSRCGS